jgi:hypothetical protein
MGGHVGQLAVRRRPARAALIGSALRRKSCQAGPLERLPPMAERPHWNVNAVDAKSFKDMLVNGGGMDAIAYAANKRITQYPGDSY